MEVREELKTTFASKLVEVKYTPKGKMEQTYFVDMETHQIFNSSGVEVFKSSAENAGKDRNLIHALALKSVGKAKDIV